MPPAIIASPRLATPARAYCTAPTSRSPRPLPFLVCGCPRRKNFSRNDLCSEFSYLTGFEHFGLEGEGPRECRQPRGLEGGLGRDRARCEPFPHPPRLEPDLR